MTQIRNVLTDFKAGELDPHLLMRNDSKAYTSGAQQAKNVIIRNTGAVSRRPGTLKLVALGGQSQLKEFEFDDDEKYILAFQDEGLRIYDESGTALTAFSGATDCPWDSDNYREITISQAGDFAFICHRDLGAIKVLERTSLTTFTMSSFSFDTSADGKVHYQPYYKFAAASVTIAPSATTGSVTLTASSALFVAGHVGVYFRLHGVELLVTAYTDSTHVTATCLNTIEETLDANPFATADGTAIVTVTHAFHGLAAGAALTISGSGDVGGITKGNLNGARTIATVIDDDHYTFTAGANATDSVDGGGTVVKVKSTAATRAWDEQVFSSVRGFPGATCFHEDRLFFASTDELPNGLWGSAVGAYHDFQVDEGADAESIQGTTGSTRISVIRHILSNRILQIFTQGSEFIAKAADDVGLTPANVNIQVQTPYGCSTVAPRVFDGATLFIQGNNKTIREFIADSGQSAYTAVDVTTLSPHLIDEPIDFAVVYGTTTRPEQYAFIINADGTMAVFHSIRSEGLAAWVPWETYPGHSFDSICVLGSKVFISALRNGSYWLERIDFDGDTTLDGAIVSEISAPGGTVFNLGADYELTTVSVTSENSDYYLGDYEAAAGGVVTLEDEFTTERIIAGYDFEFIVEILPADVMLADGPCTGTWKRINRAIVHVLDTLNLLIEGQEITARQVDAGEVDFDNPPTPLSGKYPKYFLGYERDRSLVFTQSAPLRVTLLGLALEVTV